MKVALDLQPCLKNRSGIGVYTYEMAKRLQSRDGLEFYGSIFNFLGKYDGSQSLEGLTLPLLENRLLPYRAYRLLWDVVPIPHRWMFPEKMDLSIFFNYVVPPNIDGKVITTIHDMTCLRFPETVKQGTLGRLKRGISYSLERSDHILTISEFSKREIMELLSVPEEKISVISCAFSLNGTGADWRQIEEKWQLRKPYLLYVGTIEPRKNLTRLLKAFSLLKRENSIPHQLVLAGGKGWNNEEIYRTAKEMENVIFTGYISEEEKIALYQNAEVFLFPSIYEGFGIPPLEAMTCGCPVVCANAASLPEVVGDAARLVDPLDEADIAQGIWEVLSNEELRNQMREAGYRQAKKYSWNNSAKKLTDVCIKVLNEP